MTIDQQRQEIAKHFPVEIEVTSVMIAAGQQHKMSVSKCTGAIVLQHLLYDNLQISALIRGYMWGTTNGTIWLQNEVAGVVTSKFRNGKECNMMRLLEPKIVRLTLEPKFKYIPTLDQTKDAAINRQE